MTIRELIQTNPDATDEQIVAMVPPLTPKTGPVYCTYLWLGEMLGTNASGTISEGLESWIAGIDLSTLNPQLPNKGTLKRLHNRLDDYPGIDLTSPNAPGLLTLFKSGVPGVIDPIITQDQYNFLLNAGYTINVVPTVEEVAAVRTEMQVEEEERVARETRNAQINAVRLQIDSKYYAFINDRINVALSDLNVPIPTYAEFVASL